MRLGRLQASTLANIWKSLDPRLEAATKKEGERLQKQYIPTTGDSPLFRLISIPVNEENLNEPTPVPSDGPELARRTFVQTRESRVTSAPNLPRGYGDELDDHLPAPRTIQSTGDLYSSNSDNPNHVRARQARMRLINRSISFTLKNCTLAKGESWIDDYAHIDIDWSMQAMDVLYNASFYDYIRDERNVDLSAIRLSRIIKDYKPKQVASALLWMIQGWSVENTAKLLRIVFSDWLPDLAGCVFSLICYNWPKNPQCNLCIAYILLTEPATSSALFLRSLTHSWTRKESIDLITYLDAVLKWSTPYLQEVMTVYTTSLYPSDTKEKDEDEESALENASQQLALANARLAMAEYQLALFQHWSSCPKCQEKEECEALTSLPVPEFKLGDSDLDFETGSVSKEE